MNLAVNYFHFVVFALTLVSSVISQSDPGLNSPYRLPRNNVNPHRQNLFLQLDLSDLSQDIKYEGYLEIYMYLEEPLCEMSFNAHEIYVNWERFAIYEIEGNNNIYVPTNWTHRTEHQITDVVFDTELQIGRHRAEFNFTGVVRTDQSGLYRSNYTINGETRHLITTHLEPAYARSIFPGFDEPSYITRINLTVAHNRPNYHVISNMPIAESNIQLDNGYTATRFEQTPHMPQYLLALLISDYEAQSSENSRIKTYVPAHLLDQVHYSVDFGERALTYLERWLGRQYQLPKVDFAAIPHFTFGAMENWGLITYRSTVLMYDLARPLKTIVTNIQSQAGLIVHEFTHMWFGNEVTPVYWNYVWLSEGFAQYFQYMATAELEKHWQMREQFVVRNTQSALSEDDHLNVRAMSGYIDEPRALANMFNYVVYGKSSSVIHMITEIMGVDVLQQALYSYIDERLYGTEPQYLYSHLQRAIDAAKVAVEWPAPMAMIFDSWAESQGYPLVKVTRDYDSGSVAFSQTRYLSKPEERATDQGSSQFYIPVTLKDRKQSDYDVLWLTPDHPEKTLPFVGHDDWLLVNVRQTGYYRVNYDESNWHMLTDQLHDDHNIIHVENRAQLIDDAASLANAELLDYKILLDILSYLRKDTEYIPWLSASRTLTQLERRLRGSSIYNDFEKFLVNITSGVYKNTLKIDNEDYSHVTRLHRVNTLDWACRFGNAECLNDVSVAVKNIVENIDENVNLPFIPYEIRTPIFCAASKYSDEPTQLVTYLQLIYNKWTDQAKVVEEARRVVTGMGCSQNERFLELLLGVTINVIPNGFEYLKDERTTIFDSVARGSYLGTKTALQFILNNFSAMSDQYDAIQSVFTTVAPYLVTQQLYDKFEEINIFYNEKYNEATRTSVVSARSTALQLLAWSGKHNTSIANWMAQQDFNNENEADSAGRLIPNSIFLCILGTLTMIFRNYLYA